MINGNIRMIMNNMIIYDNINKRYLYFNADEIEDTDYHPRKGQEKRRFYHMCHLHKVDPKTMTLVLVGRENKFDIYQRLITYEYREITKAEKAKFLLAF